jgi:hypothetical protein
MWIPEGVYLVAKPGSCNALCKSGSSQKFLPELDELHMIMQLP